MTTYFDNLFLTMNFIDELKWRGMLHDIMPGTEEKLKTEQMSAYVGFDPTADSLHIGHLVQVMLLRHFQNAGHQPIALIGGATGMIGDPSGKSNERSLLTEEELNNNQNSIKIQLGRFLDFESDIPNRALLVNNYDWMKDYSFLGFIRDIGKHITVNYMMSKDSVKKRLGSESNQGMSFTEFSYQLVQGYDFLYLYRELNCRLQMGGSDQWGNIVTGTELIRRKEGGEAYALTCPLITRSDGSKFGKTESGNVWLDPEKTSPYSFYQFWLNVSDEDAGRYIRIFTMLGKEEIESLEREHAEAPHMRILQNRLAEEMTVIVHSREELDTAIEASQILFGKGTTDTLKKINEKTFLSLFEGVPVFDVKADLLETGTALTDLCTLYSSVFGSKGEMRRLVQGGGVSVNKQKVSDPDMIIDQSLLLNGKYLLVQKGKKSYFIIRVIE